RAFAKGSSGSYRYLLEWRARFRHNALITRVANAERFSFMRQLGCVHEITHHRLFHQRRHNHVGETSEVGEFVRGERCCPVRTCETRTIEAKVHRKVLNTDVVYYLIVRPLHERTVYVAIGNETLHSKSGGERHSMLLSNSHIERPIGHFLHHDVKRRTRRHSGRDADNFVVLPGQLPHRMAKDILVSRWLNRLVFSPGNLAGDLIKLARRMPGCCVAVLCRTVA